jgi:hypothetical protein
MVGRKNSKYRIKIAANSYLQRILAIGFPEVSGGKIVLYLGIFASPVRYRSGGKSEK